MVKKNRLALAVLAVFGVAAIVGILVTAPFLPGDSVREEVLRASAQTLILVLVGFAVTMVTFTLQQGRLDRIRADERLRTVFAATVDAYNEVKQIRRMFKAETKAGHRREIDVDTYTRLMTELSRQQLVFEDLKRSAGLIEDALPKTGTVRYETADGAREARLRDLFRDIEKYLDGLVDEYEENRHLVASDGRMSLDEPNLAKLKAFVANSSSLRREVTQPVHGILNALDTSQLGGSTSVTRRDQAA